MFHFQSSSYACNTYFCFHDDSSSLQARRRHPGAAPAQPPSVANSAWMFRRVSCYLTLWHRQQACCRRVWFSRNEPHKVFCQEKVKLFIVVVSTKMFSLDMQLQNASIKRQVREYEAQCKHCEVAFFAASITSFACNYFIYPFMMIRHLFQARHSIPGAALT